MHALLFCISLHVCMLVCMPLLYVAESINCMQCEKLHGAGMYVQEAI